MFKILQILIGKRIKTNICSNCQKEVRRLWTFVELPKTETIDNANWISLEQCPVCKQFWLISPHEPYASFTFLTRWDYSLDEYLKIKIKVQKINL